MLSFATLKKYDVVEISWLDANRDKGWVAESEYLTAEDPDSSLGVTTVGYFIQETKNSVMVVQSVQGSFIDIDNNFDALMQIPKVCITNVKKLR